MRHVTAQTGRIFKVLLTSCMVVLISSACAVDLPTAKVTLKMVDESGMPIEGAKASLTFDDVYMLKRGINTKTISSLTDKDGIVTASNNTIRDVAYGVELDGYYKSRGEYSFAKQESGKWQPWNPEIKVVMRKIEKPVPMYARDLKNSFPNVDIPVIGKTVGFDLVECDWVAPYGNGHHSDFIFKLEKQYIDVNKYDAKLTITFPNKLDGMKIIKDDRKGGSMFKLPRYAPEEGYQNKLTRILNRHGAGAPESDFSDDNNYIFRIRTEEKNGKLIQAMYGKILGDIRFYPGESKTAALGFKYFLNPDYTRNLEFGENLFKNLKSTEQVRSDN